MKTTHTQVAQEIRAVEDLSEALRHANASLRESLEEALAVLVPVGTIIDKRDRHAPIWLRGIGTLAGNDRGVGRFEVASPLRVSVDNAHITLSKWRCEAHPLSDKDGKRLSGRQRTVEGDPTTMVLTGGVVCTARADYMGLTGEAYRLACTNALLSVIEAAEEMLRPKRLAA